MENIKEREFKTCTVIAYYRIIEPEEIDLQEIEIDFDYNSKIVFEDAIEENTAKVIRKRCVNESQSFEVVEIIDRKDGRVLFKERIYQ